MVAGLAEMGVFLAFSDSILLPSRRVWHAVVVVES
jgi:hypothetical protein